MNNIAPSPLSLVAHYEASGVLYLRIKEIIGQAPVTMEQAEANKQAGISPKQPKEAIPALVPISRPTWYRGVQSGQFPKPVRFGRSAFWRLSDIKQLLQQVEAGVA